MPLRFKLPVIKANPKPKTKVENKEDKIIRVDPFVEMPQEIVMMYLLPLDADSLISACSTSPSVRQICDDEYFWKSKAQQDFDVTDDFNISKERSWKNYYFNLAYPERYFKQLINRKDFEMANLLAQSNLTNPGFDVYKMFLWALERYEKGLNDLINGLVEYFGYANLSIDEVLSLQILCALSSIADYEWYNTMKFIFNNQFSTETYETEALRCALLSESVDFIRRAYTSYLNINGIKNERANRGAKPSAFVRYLEEVGLERDKIDRRIKVLESIYRSYTGVLRAHRIPL